MEYVETASPTTLASWCSKFDFGGIYDGLVAIPAKFAGRTTTSTLAITQAGADLGVLALADARNAPAFHNVAFALTTRAAFRIGELHHAKRPREHTPECPLRFSQRRNDHCVPSGTIGHGGADGGGAFTLLLGRGVGCFLFPILQSPSMTDTVFTTRLDEMEAIANGLLTKVKAEFLREHLRLALRDIEEARAWVRLDENSGLAEVVAGFAANRIAYVEQVVTLKGYDAVVMGG